MLDNVELGRPSGGGIMTVDRAVQWLAYAARRSVDDVWAIVGVLPDDSLVELGVMLENSVLLNPPTHRPVKVHRAVCQCGCGQWFEREYRTNKPKYKSDAHKAHAAYVRRRLAGKR